MKKKRLFKKIVLGLISLWSFSILMTAMLGNPEANKSYIDKLIWSFNLHTFQMAPSKHPLTSWAYTKKTYIYPEIENGYME